MGYGLGIYTEHKGVVGDRGGWRRCITDSRAPTDIFLRFFGRTDLRIGASRAKNCEEVDGEVRLPVQPPKLALKGETNVSRPKNFVEQKIFWPKIELMGIV